MALHLRKKRLPRPNLREHRHFWIGTIGLAVVGLIVVGSGTFFTAAITDHSVTAEFEQAAGLHTGDVVKVSGIDVGKVSGLKLSGDHVEVTLKVHRSVHLGADALASIKVATLLGAHYVELIPGDGHGLPGGVIRLSNTTVPYNLSDVIQVGTPKFEQLDAKQLSRTLDVLNRQFGDSAPLAAQALDSVGELTKVLNDRRDQFDSLLKNLDKVTRILSDNRNNLLVVIRQGDAIATRITERQALLRALLDNVASISRQLQQLGAQNNGKIGPTIRQLETITQGLEKNRENLDRMLEIMPVTLRQFTNLTGNGNYGDLYAPWIFPDNWLCFAHVAQGCK